MIRFLQCPLVLMMDIFAIDSVFLKPTWNLKSDWILLVAAHKFIEV